MNKKAVSPIIATILLLILAVISSILLFGWYKETKTDLGIEITKKTNSGQIELLEVNNGILHIRNFGNEKQNIKSIEINDVDCDVSSFELFSGLNEIDIFSCVNEIETGYKKIFIKTKDEIIKDTLFIEGLYTFNPSTGFCDSSFRDSGNGSSSRPYLICDNNSLSNIGNGNTNYFLLVKNINLEGSSSNPWTPISNFAGNLEGGGFLINNLYVDTSGSYGGLFGKTERGSSIKNIGVKTLYIKSNQFSGGLAGTSSSSISNSYVVNINSIIFSNSRVGGFVGQSNSFISNSYVINTNSNISSDYSVSGGFIGYSYSYGSISNSYAINTNSNISGPYVGGFIGYSSQSSLSNLAVSWLGDSNSINGTTKEILLGYRNSEEISNFKYYNESPIIGDPLTTYGTNFSSEPNFYSNNVNTSFIYDNWDTSIWKFNTNDYPTLR